MVACSRGSCIVQNHAQMLINMVKILLTLSLAFHLKYQWLPFPIRNMHGYSYYCFQNLASYHSSNLFICNFCMVLIFSACSYMCNKTVHNMMTIKDSAYHVTLLVVFGFGILCIDNCILMHQYKNACSSSNIYLMFHWSSKNYPIPAGWFPVLRLHDCRSSQPNYNDALLEWFQQFASCNKNLLVVCLYNYYYTWGRYNTALITVILLFSFLHDTFD